MDLKKLRYIEEFLIEQANHWMFFPIALIAMGTTKLATGRTKPDVLLWAVCGLIPLGFFMLRILCNKIRRIVYCILLHMAAPVLVIVFLRFLPITVSAAICAACVVMYTLYSLFLIIKAESLYSNRMPMPVGIGLSVVSAITRRDDHWENYYITAMIGVAALFFIIFYMQHYMDFLSVNNSSAGYLPASEMFRSGLGLVIGYTVFGMFLLALLTQFELLAGIMQPLKDFFLQILRYVMKLLLKLLSMSSTEEPQRQAEGMSSEAFDILPAAGGGITWFWVLLEYVGIAVVIFGFLYVIAKLLLQLIQFLQRYFTRRTSVKGEFEDEVVDFREKCALDKSTEKKKLDLFGFLSYREQVRRLYKKKVISSSPQISMEDRARLGIYTAREWGEKLEADGQMAEFYEYARYTEREITAADVKKMKEACKTGKSGK